MGSQTTTSKNGSTLSALGEDQDSGEFVNTGEKHLPFCNGEIFSSKFNYNLYILSLIKV